MTKKAPSLALSLQLMQCWVGSLKTHTQLASSSPLIFCKLSVAWDSSASSAAGLFHSFTLLSLQSSPWDPSLCPSTSRIPSGFLVVQPHLV